MLDDECWYDAALVAAPEHGAYGSCASTTAAHVVRIAIDGVEYSEAPGQFNPEAIIVDPTDREHILVGSNRETIHDSDDGGRSWYKHGSLPTMSDAASMRSVAVDSSDFDHFVTTDWEYAWFTETAGDSFEPVSFDIDGNVRSNVYVSELAMAPSDPTVVYAIVEGSYEAGMYLPGRGLYLSRDGGRTFAKTALTPRGRVIYVHPQDAARFWSFTLEGGDGMDIPPDSALLWHIDGDEESSVSWNNTLQTLAYSPADPDVIYLGASLQQPF